MPYSFAKLIAKSLENLSKGNQRLINSVEALLTTVNTTTEYQNNNDGKRIKHIRTILWSI